MILGIPVDKNSMNGSISTHFGRTEYFLIYDTENNKSKFIDNSAASSSGGAGIKAAQIVVDNNVDTLISPRLGQNAYDVINSQNIKIYQSINGSIEDNIKALSEGKLSLLNDIHEGFHGHETK